MAKLYFRYGAMNCGKSTSLIQVDYNYRERNMNIGLKRPRQIIGNINISSPTPHSLRHAFAVDILNHVKKRGASPQNALPVLAAYMGCLFRRFRPPKPGEAGHLFRLKSAT